MNNPIRIIRKKNEKLKIEIPAAPSWNGFDEIISFLVKEYRASILERNDGPYWRKWIIEVSQHRMELLYEDQDGNCLQACDEDSEPIVLQIGQDLEERLMGDLFEIDGNLQGRMLKTERSAILTFWHNNKDLTGIIYKNLDNKKSSFKDVQLFGAPFSYELLMIPLEYSDELLNDIKMMDKSDLEKNLYEEMQSILMKD